MKKFLFVVISFFAFLFMAYDIVTEGNSVPFVKNNDSDYRESYNNETNMLLARNIAGFSEAEKVAVVGNDMNIFVGITLKPGEGERELLKKRAEELIKQKYKKAEVKIEIETEKTEEIFDIAERLENGDSNKSVLSKINNLLDD